ncbi:MAG: hypothetical protein MUC62_06755 [Candidatus Thermoplasmatota archaeon]|jgi:hypothetical protein|nr:hypothetical protein [Candidatus Thermoplasmatota archaeon]
MDPPETWRAAVCFDAPSTASKLREAMDALGWDYERDRGMHHFSRLYIVISMPTNSYTFRFNVKRPIKVQIDVYEERPNHSAELRFVEVKGLDRKSAPKVRELLNEFAAMLPRRPYEFFWQERFRAGLLNRHHLTARREWSRWGL